MSNRTAAGRGSESPMDATEENASAAARNVKLVIAYNGTGYHGWQRQPDVPTVQECVEAAAGRVLTSQ